LYVKVLALEDANGGKVVLMTSDLGNLSRHLTEAVAEGVQRHTGLTRERLMLTCSHAHMTPLLRGILLDMSDVSTEQERKVSAYTNQLEKWMIETIVAALDNLQPANLAIGKSTARFAVNRRKPTPKGVDFAPNPDGPVDHDVPVMRVTTPEGK